MMIASSLIYALPTGPVITYVSNSSAASLPSNRTQDEKGTITVITMVANQQDYKWKAYVGNVSGKLALDDGTAFTIYDWTMGTPSGEVYVTRASTVNWPNVTCASQAMIYTEENEVDISSATVDSINSTFNSQSHKSFSAGTVDIVNSSCRSTATYVSDASQVVNETSVFQEILLGDAGTSNLIYATTIEDNALGYNNQTYDFQLLVAENESATVPFTYFFYVELG